MSLYRLSPFSLNAQQSRNLNSLANVPKNLLEEIRRIMTRLPTLRLFQLMQPLKLFELRFQFKGNKLFNSVTGIRS